MYTLEDGIFLVKLARSAIERYLEDEKLIAPPEKLEERAGVFVTLETYPKKDLRGCIGYSEPAMPLVEGVIRAAVSAAVQDPRFPPVLLGEMESTLIEVSVLTPPELIKVRNPKEYLQKIEIGKHGLTVERGFNRGLLLPQVPVEEKWSKEEFLSCTRMKAGLPPDCWWDEGTKIYKFSGIVFCEIEPKGEVVEKKLTASQP